MRSLRLRFFLTVWPLVVLALAAVALTFGRWVQVEVDRIERAPADPTLGRQAAWARTLGARWTDAGGVLDGLRRTSGDGERLRLLALDTTGRPHASSGPAAQGETLRWRGGGVLAVERRVVEAGDVRVTARQTTGTPVRAPDGRRLGWLYALGEEPSIAATGAPAGSPLRLLASGAQRRLWVAVVLASLVAAIVTWLLARPIVAQVRRLADAAGRIRGGALDARVAVTSRDELGRLEAAFNEMAESLERSEASKRRMISDVSHELRTPLTNVVGLLEAVRDGLRPADPATLDLARDEALGLAALVDELQELSTAEAGAMRFDLEPLDVVAEAWRAVAASAAPGGPTVALGPAVPATVHADRRRLAQVLRNLLRNAVAHSAPGGSVRVEVAPAAEPGFVDVAVVDDGEGIPAEHLPLVWERFHRVDPSRSRATGGMGLGLAVVRQLVLGMGGRVRAESERGRGSRFVVSLPAA